MDSSVLAVNVHQFQFFARQFRAGKISLNDFTDRILNGESAPEDMPDRDSDRMETGVNIDLDRARRCGFPEVIYGEGKTLDELQHAISVLVDHQQNALVTRVNKKHGNALFAEFRDGHFNERARTFRVNRFARKTVNPNTIAVVTAGTADRPIAEETLETIAWMNLNAFVVLDVGVAGPQRIHEHLDKLKTARVAVVVAGVDGALPSVVAGHLSCPVIALPTSVGYGASLGGIAALLTMINSCAANVAVVNIDAGFKAGYVAGLIVAGESLPQNDRDCSIPANG